MKAMLFYREEREVLDGLEYKQKTFTCLSAITVALAAPLAHVLTDSDAWTTDMDSFANAFAIPATRCGYFLGSIDTALNQLMVTEQARVDAERQIMETIADVATTALLAVGPLAAAMAFVTVEVPALEEAANGMVNAAIKSSAPGVAITDNQKHTFQDTMNSIDSLDSAFSLMIDGDSPHGRTLMTLVDAKYARVVGKGTQSSFFKKS